MIRKLDDARGENTAHTHVEKAADEADEKAQKIGQKYDKANSIFTKQCCKRLAAQIG